MIRKCAIFTEGMTEQTFVENVLLTVAGEANISIESTRAEGPGQARRYKPIDFHRVGSGQKYHALICNCRGDESVKTDIRNQYKTLIKNNYDTIIGIRDVYPKTFSDIPLMRKNLYFGLRQKPIRTVMILSIMEVEAWFLAEYTHFPKINAALDLSRVSSYLGFDPSVAPAKVEDRAHPAGDLANIYRTAGESYDKKVPATMARTINSLDYIKICLELGGQIPSLIPLINEVNSFLA